MVAIGALDYYVIGKEYLRIIDIASSTLILREAGGVVKNIYGEELDMAFNLNERSSVLPLAVKMLLKELLQKIYDFRSKYILINFLNKPYSFNSKKQFAQASASIKAS